MVKQPHTPRLCSRHTHINREANKNRVKLEKRNVSIHWNRNKFHINVSLEQLQTVKHIHTSSLFINVCGDHLLGKPTNLKDLLTVFLLVLPSEYLVTTFIMNIVLNMSFQYWIRFYFFKAVPLLIMGLYLWRKPFKKLAWSSLAASFLVLTALVYAYADNTPLTVFFGEFHWSYTAAITWTLAYIGFFLVTFYKTKNESTACTYAILSVSAGGLIYEIPTLLTNLQYEFLSQLYPLILPTAILSLCLLAYLLYRENWHYYVYEARLFFSCWLLLNWNIIYGLHPFGFNSWLPRLPTIFFLILLPFHIRKPEAKLKNGK